METKQTKSDAARNNASTCDSGAPPPAYCSNSDYVEQGYASPYPSTHYFHSTDAIQFGLDSAAGHSQVLTVTQTQQSPVNQETYMCYIMGACFTFWLCWGLFGAIAFLLAAAARTKSAEGDQQSARAMGNGSLAVTVIGIIVGCAGWGVFIWWFVTISWRTCYYTIDGLCYNVRVCNSFATPAYCATQYPGSVYNSGCCFYVG